VQALRISPLRRYGVKREEFPSIIEKAKASNSMKGNPWYWAMKNCARSSTRVVTRFRA